MTRTFTNKVHLARSVCIFFLLSIHLCSVICQCSSSTNLTATETEQEFTSPFYPNYYANNLDCLWYLSADNSSHVIQLTFLDLSTEDSGLCFSDYVILYDGPVSLYTLHGYYCGSKIPERVLSSGSLITMKFRTDSSKVSRGFKAKYISGPLSSFDPIGGEDSSKTSVSVLLGASIGAAAVAVTIVTIVLIYKYTKAKKITISSPQTRRRRQLPPFRVQPYDYYGNDPPPAYTETYISAMSPPPAYSETIASPARGYL